MKSTHSIVFSILAFRGVPNGLEHQNSQLAGNTLLAFRVSGIYQIPPKCYDAMFTKKSN